MFAFSSGQIPVPWSGIVNNFAIQIQTLPEWWALSAPLHHLTWPHIFRLRILKTRFFTTAIEKPSCTERALNSEGPLPQNRFNNFEKYTELEILENLFLMMSSIVRHQDYPNPPEQYIYMEGPLDNAETFNPGFESSMTNGTTPFLHNSFLSKCGHLSVIIFRPLETFSHIFTAEISYREVWSPYFRVSSQIFGPGISIPCPKLPNLSMRCSSFPSHWETFATTIVNKKRTQLGLAEYRSVKPKPV